MTIMSYNYARELDAVGQYQKAICIADLGRRACVEYDEHQFHPGLLHIMAECQHYLGNDAESRELYLRAYYCYKACEANKNLGILKRDAQEQVNIALD